MAAFLDSSHMQGTLVKCCGGRDSTQMTKMWFLPSKRCRYTVTAVETCVSTQLKRYFLLETQHERRDPWTGLFRMNLPHGDGEEGIPGTGDVALARGGLRKTQICQIQTLPLELVGAMWPSPGAVRETWFSENREPLKVFKEKNDVRRQCTRKPTLASKQTWVKQWF